MPGEAMARVPLTDTHDLGGVLRDTAGRVEGTFKEKNIAFTVSVNMQGNEIALVYTGILEADGTLKGTVDLGGMASGTWTGRKAED